jgi:hypothetical protein
MKLFPLQKAKRRSNTRQAGRTSALVVIVFLGACLLAACQPHLLDSGSSDGSGGAMSWACTSDVPNNDASQGGWVYWENSGCPIYPTIWGNTDPSFAGWNSTAGPTDGGVAAVGQDVWSPICTDSSGNLVDINATSCVNRETQTLQANSPEDFAVTNDTPTNPSGSVTAYPNVGTYAYTGVLDNYTSLTSTYSQSMPINPQTSAWAMQDDWLSQPGDARWDYEVMIQTDSTNHASCDSTWQQGRWGYVAMNVSIGGQLWHVCDGQAAHNADGSCPGSGCGAVVFELGGTEADDPSVASSSGTLDLEAMFQWLETHNVPGTSYPYMRTGSSIAALSQGWEIASTGGVPEQFVGSGFTVTATGGAAG